MCKAVCLTVCFPYHVKQYCASLSHQIKSMVFWGKNLAIFHNFIVVKLLNFIPGSVKKPHMKSFNHVHNFKE